MMNVKQFAIVLRDTFPSRPFWLLTLLAGALASGAPAHAGEGGLYGPVAPPGSAFVRVFNVTGASTIDAHIGDQTMPGIPADGASGFIFLPAGRYTLAAGSASAPVSLQADRYYTAVASGHGIKVLENEGFSNKLKARVILYNLVDGSPLSLRTADGKTTVINGVAAGASGTRDVNAVNASLALYDSSGKKLADAKPVNLERGKVFSLFVSGGRDQPELAWVVN